VNAFLRITAWIIALSLVAAPLIAISRGWMGAERWPMKVLRVNGEFSRVDEQQVRNAVMPYVRDGFFAVDLPGIKQSIGALPWVEEVEVRKRWPDRLEVEVREHKPLARWGKDKMLSESGLLFPMPKGDHSRLPLFIANDDRAVDLLSFYSQARPLFLQSGQFIAQINLSQRASWHVRLDDGLELEIGRTEAVDRMQRFARLYPKIRRGENGRKLRYADLRYTNGFSLRWEKADSAQNIQIQASSNT
jgi:cell division protein FtsQ